MDDVMDRLLEFVGPDERQKIQADIPWSDILLIVVWMGVLMAVFCWILTA